MIQELIKFKKKELRACKKDLQVIISNRTRYVERVNFDYAVSLTMTRIYKLQSEIKGLK